MKTRSDNIWLTVTAGSAVAAAISAVEAILSIDNGDLILAVISMASLTLFAICAITAWNIRSRLSTEEKADEEVKCLRLKKPGIERRSEEIVPKGKMPRD